MTITKVGILIFVNAINKTAQNDNFSEYYLMDCPGLLSGGPSTKTRPALSPGTAVALVLVRHILRTAWSG